MPSTDPVPSPAAFRQAPRPAATFAWVGILLLAAAGLIYAAVDVADGTATTGAAASSFAGPVTAPEPDLVRSGLNKKYGNRVLLHVGLCICLYDLEVRFGSLEPLGLLQGGPKFRHL